MNSYTVRKVVALLRALPAAVCRCPVDIKPYDPADPEHSDECRALSDEARMLVDAINTDETLEKDDLSC